VPVDAERNRRGRMSEPPTDGQDIYSGRNQAGGVGVAQSMQGDFHVGSLHGPRPFLGQRTRAARFTVPSRKHEGGFGCLAEPKSEPLFLLLLPVHAQLGGDLRRERDGPAAVLGFGGFEAQAGFRLLERLYDPQRAAIEVNVLPPQPQ
jgi:hypothetical protein